MQDPILKIISLNIEMDRHLDGVTSFFKEQQPDVVLLQEVLGKDKARLEEATGMKGIYTVQNIIYSETSALTAVPSSLRSAACPRSLSSATALDPANKSRDVAVGMAIEAEKSESYLGLLTLTKLPIIKNSHIFYRGDGLNPQRMTVKEPEKTARAITITEVVKGTKTYCLLNTHFTWTPNAQPNDDQQEDLGHLLTHLTNIPEFILCGDFNAPRGTPIFDAIALKYQDNIPLHITTTIDKKLHRCGDLGIVVDGVFTTPGYEVLDVCVVDSLSDHCAIVTMVRAR